MHEHEQHAVVAEVQILRIGRIGDDRLQGIGVQHGRVGEDDLPQRREPLQRVASAGTPPMAIGPFVVAGRVQEGRRLRSKQVRDTLDACVTAGLTAALDVADVDDERRALGRCILQQGAQIDHLAVGIWRVTEGEKTHWLGLRGDRHEQKNNKHLETKQRQHAKGANLRS